MPIFNAAPWTIALSTALALTLGACTKADRAPVDEDDGTAALPAVGEKLPEFRFPTFHGPPAASAELRGKSAIIALWIPFAASGDTAMAQFDSLMIESNELETVRFVVLARMQPVSNPYQQLNQSWIARSTSAAFAPNAKLIFERPSPDGDPSVELQFPSFIMIDEEGRVVRRAHRMPRAVFKPVLDSIRLAERRKGATRDTALADSLRGVLAEAFRSFDPVTLRGGDHVSMSQCNDEGIASAAIIPATVALLDLDGDNGRLLAKIEVTSVARHDGPSCSGPLRMRPVTAVDTLSVWMRIEDSAWVMEDPNESIRLVSPADSTIEFRGTTLAEIRARIDSVRRARR
jgi:hypothetical protein